MKITREVIEQIQLLTLKVQKTEETASELLKTAQDRHGHVRETVTRSGKTGQATQKELWEEVFILGPKGHEAAEILKGKHPEVFEAYEEQNKAAGALQKYINENLHIDYSQMRISDYMKLTEAMVNLIIDEREKKTETKEEA